MAIQPLDSGRKSHFIRPASRINQAYRQTHDLYHERTYPPDFLADYETVREWIFITASYSGIEQAMKCLLQMRGIKYGKIHDLYALFQKMVAEEQNPVRRSYKIYQSLHDYIPPTTADDFLKIIDNGYGRWRYYLLEGKPPPKNHTGVTLDIWGALTCIIQARVFADHGLRTVKDRISDHLANRQSAAFRKDAWANPPNTSHWQALSNLLNSRPIRINYYADLIWRNTHNKPIQQHEIGALAPALLQQHETSDKEPSDIDNDYRQFLDSAGRYRIQWDPRQDRFVHTDNAQDPPVPAVGR